VRIAPFAHAASRRLHHARAEPTPLIRENGLLTVTELSAPPVVRSVKHRLQVGRRRDMAVGVVFMLIGFTPIAALALTIGGLWTLSVGSVVLIAPALVVGAILGLLSPCHGRRAVEGFVAGLAAVLVYDLVRWTFVGFGWWGDFIPTIGGWLNGTGQPDWLLGYTFRWLGDGGGMGLTFMVGARSVLPAGLRRRSAYGVAVAYGLGIWACLIITLIVTAEGQLLLFPLTPLTLLLSCAGHIVYGLVLGAFVARADSPSTSRRRSRVLCEPAAARA
jgi:hypothetical protein